jgi:hypothetical protein
MTTAAKVGAFFLLALALTGILIWNIEDLKLGRKLGKTVSMQFEDVAGLKEKADVRVAGVLVGRVAKIRLVGGRAVVDVELEKDVELHQGAAADVATLGMLGENISIQTSTAPKRRTGRPKGRGASHSTGQPLAQDIEIDLRDVTGNLTKSWAARADRAHRDRRGQHGQAVRFAAPAGRDQPGRHRRPPTTSAISSNSDARGAHRPLGRRQPGQRDRHRGQREGTLHQAPGHDRQRQNAITGKSTRGRAASGSS